MSAAGNKCCYLNCGKSRKTWPGLHLFTFPGHDENRCRVWIRNTGNSTLHDISPSKIKNKRICEFHFEDDQFRNSLKQNLNRNAVPRPFKQFTDSVSDSEHSSTPIHSWQLLLKESLGTPSTSTNIVQPVSPIIEVNRNENDRKYMACKTSTNSPNAINSHEETVSPTLNFLLNCDSPSNKIKGSTNKTQLLKRNLFVDNQTTPRKKALIKLVITQRVKLKKQNSRISYLQKKNLKLQKKTPYDITNNKLFISMQTEHKARQRWFPEFVNLAQSVYFASPKAYRTLREQGVILPGISTLQKKLSKFNVQAGFSSEVVYRISQSLQKQFPVENDRICVLLLDEMSIKKDIQYNKSLDAIEGFEDLGRNNRRAQYATQAMVFMLTGIRKRWKIPLAYHFTANSMKSEDIVQAIQECIKISKEHGLYIKVVVCDQGPANRSAIKKLGVTKEMPFITLENENIYFMYDVPHLMKSFRNQLLVNDFYYNGHVVSWTYIRQVYDIDRQGVARALPRIGDIHIRPNSFQKMKCKYALQIFSHSMAAAIRTAVAKRQLPETATPTADFVDFMNTTFDALNSTTFRVNCANKIPLSDKNLHIKMNLEKALTSIEQLKRTDLKVPPCFEGFIISIRSVLLIYENLKSNNNFDYLMTRRLCQDPLENFFAFIRSKGGFDRNPTAKSFRLSFRHIVVSKLTFKRDGNCQADQSEIITYTPPTSDINI